MGTKIRLCTEFCGLHHLPRAFLRASIIPEPRDPVAKTFNYYMELERQWLCFGEMTEADRTVDK